MVDSRLLVGRPYTIPLEFGLRLLPYIRVCKLSEGKLATIYNLIHVTPI